MGLKIEVEWLHAPGLFEAKLENGARFTFRREDIGGKLENNLTLYRQAVAQAIKGKALRPSGDKDKERKDIIRLSAEKAVQVVGVKRPKVDLNLDDLDIDF